MEPSSTLRKLTLHRRSVFNLQFTLLTFSFVLTPLQAFASRAYEGEAPPIYVEYVTIPQGGTVTFETTNLSSGTDPVLHLLRRGPSGSYFQVAYNDNHSGLNAKIVFQNQTANTNLCSFASCKVLR